MPSEVESGLVDAAETRTAAADEDDRVEACSGLSRSGIHAPMMPASAGAPDSLERAHERANE